MRERCECGKANGIYFYNGNRINPVAKSIGAGVWEVSHKEGEG